MPAVTKAKPLIPIQGARVEFPFLPPIDEPIYLGTIQNKGVYVANDLVAAVYIDETIDNDLCGEISLSRKKKITYKNGAFYLDRDRVVLESTDHSFLVKSLMESYITFDGKPLTLKGGILDELAKIERLISKFHFNLVSQYLDGSFFIMRTFADNYDNDVLKIVNRDWVILVALDSVPDGCLFIPSFYDALLIVGSKPFRVGFDSHGRLVFFTADTAVIIPNLKNKGLAGMCTEATLSKYDADCGVVVSRELDNVITLCGRQCRHRFTGKIESLLSKEKTSTPIVNELATGKCKWKRSENQKTVNIGGVNLRIVAECEKLRGYENERVKVIGRQPI